MATDFGSDLSCVSTMDPTCTVVTGRRMLAEALVRRITTPRGRLIGDPNYGFDAAQYIDDDLRPSDVANLQSGISAECLKDERVISCAVSATLDVSGVLSIDISVTDADGPFDLTVAVTKVTSELLSVG